MTAPSDRAPVPAALAGIDPERIAAALSAIVVSLAAVVLVTSGALRSTAVPTASPEAQTSLPPASTVPSSAASSVPSIAVPAGVATLIATNVEILRARADLLTETGSASPDAGTIARTLRALNPLLAAAETQARSVVSPAAPAMAEDLLTTYEAARDASTRTLRGSVSSAAAYVEGGRTVADLLAPIAPLTRDVAVLAGVEPPPEARATGVGSPSPAP